MVLPLPIRALSGSDLGETMDNYVKAGEEAIMNLMAHHGQYPPYILAGEVIKAVEPLLRADIANEIERRTYPVDPYEGRQEIYAYHEAARIVRGSGKSLLGS